MLTLSRACSLDDYLRCPSIEVWQQYSIDSIFTIWREKNPRAGLVPTLGVNWTGYSFRIPGPVPTTSQTRDEKTLLYKSDVDRNDWAAIFALGVLDRVEKPVVLLRRASHRLRINGILCLTFAYWDAEGDDTADGHEERVRIYNAASVKKLIKEARTKHGFTVFCGEVDWKYHAPLPGGDHTLYVLTLRKRGHAEEDELLVRGESDA